MNSTQVLIPYVVAIAVILVVFVFAVVFAMLLTRSVVRRIQSGQGPLGSVLQQSRDVARERLQVEKELLAAQKETNELLKQITTQLDKKT